MHGSGTKEASPSFRIASLLEERGDLGLLLITCLGLVSSLVILLFSFQASRSVLAAYNESMMKREQVRHLSELLTALIDAETSVRGYLLTGDAPFLDPYTEAIQAIPEMLDKLERDAVLDPSAGARLPALTRLVDQRRQSMQELLSAREAQPDITPQALKPQLLRGKEIMDTIRAEIGPWMALARADSLALREETERRAGRTLYFLFALLAILGLCGAAGSYLLVRGARLWRNSVRATAESELRLYAILDHSSTPTFFKDPAGRYTFVNQAWLDLFCVTKADALGKTDEEMFGQVRASEWMEHDREVLRRRQMLEYEEIASCCGEQRTYRVQKFPIFGVDGIINGLCGIAFDITHIKEREASLTAAREEADRASASKSEFLSRMSHELRTPMNSVLGFAQLLQRSELTAEQREFTGHILRAGRHLLGLINEVLDITRIETGQLSLSPEAVDVSRTLRDAAAMVRPLADQRGITISCETPEHDGPYARADAQRLSQVALNLLMNAVKYNRDVGEVHLTIHHTKPGWVRVNVRDTGPGIPAAFEKRIFTPFDRLDATASVEGTGLGLALCRGLVSAMGGEMGHYNNPDLGSTFWFELREAEAPQLPEDMAHTNSARSDAPLVLYIEDNPANYTLVERLLEDIKGARFMGAMQGSLGIALAKEHRPALILLDLNLPDMTGFEVLRRLRAEPETRSIPICMLTADANSAMLERARALGVNEYITKPFDINEFGKLLQQYLGDANYVI